MIYVATEELLQCLNKNPLNDDQMLNELIG